MSNEELSDIYLIYPKEITQENYELVLDSLIENSKNKINGPNSQWISGLIELSKKMHKDIMTNSADIFNYSFDEIEEWQFVSAAAIANEVCAKNHNEGTESSICLLEEHFYNLDILYEYYPNLLVSNLLMSCLLIGLPQSFKDGSDFDGSDLEEKSNELIDEASKRADKKFEERSRAS